MADITVILKYRLEISKCKYEAGDNAKGCNGKKGGFVKHHEQNKKRMKLLGFEEGPRRRIYIRMIPPNCPQEVYRDDN